MIGFILFALLNMLIDVYLMAQSFYDDQNLANRIKSYLWAIAKVFDALRPLPMWRLVPPLKFGFNLIGIFTLEINIEGGVSCLGMQAPMYLFMNFVIISILVVLFDSSIFLFLRVSPEDFRLPASGVLRRCGAPAEASRLAEEAVIRGLFIGAGRNMKTIIQLVMAKMLWSSFMPYWKPFSPACEAQQQFSETVAVWGTSVLFWVLFIPMLHLLLNTAVYGIASKKTDKSFGQAIDIANGGMRAYYLNAERKVAITDSVKGESDASPDAVWHHIHSARIAEGYRNDGHSDGTFKFYCFAIRCMNRCCSITRCCFKDWIDDVEVDEVGPEELELFEHDPRFWQQPWQFLEYFIKEQSGGSTIVGLSKYFYTLGWKTWQLVKMTVGYWDHSLIDNMQIKARANKLNLHHIEGELRHEEMLANVGLLHALIWQLLPYCVCVGKAGEALNDSPIFVYDDTARYTVQEAIRRQKFLDGEYGEEAEFPAMTVSNNPMRRWGRALRRRH